MNIKKFVDNLRTNSNTDLRSTSYALALITAVFVGVVFTQTPQSQSISNSGSNLNTEIVEPNSSLAKVNGGFVTGIAAAEFKPEFRLSIAKISLKQTVQADVDPANQDVYSAVINEKVAHGLGTRLPDEAILDGNVYLFAHRNGVYNGKKIGFFHRLDDLNQGDVAIIEYNGTTYEYKLREKFVITPQDTWVYTEQAETPTLTLQTCENGETQRLIVKFDLVAIRG